jgi:hypothetical protein
MSKPITMASYCVPVKYLPEIHMHIFKDTLGLFFAAYPNLKEPQYRRPKLPVRYTRKRQRVFAGIPQKVPKSRNHPLH